VKLRWIPEYGIFDNLQGGGPQAPMPDMPPPTPIRGGNGGGKPRNFAPGAGNA
jgi:hypothetical protein